MRKLGVIVLLSMSLIALMAPAVQAKHSGHGSSGKSAKTATFAARSNAGEQGGNLQVRAMVKHPARGATFTATAVVHFASGDVAVTLSRHGKSFNASAKVPVAADEALGPVTVDVTVTYNGTDAGVQATGKVVPADEDEDDTDEDTDED